MPKGPVSFQRVAGRTPDDFFNSAVAGISGEQVREIHATQNGQVYDFRWTYAKPLEGEHFKW